MDNRETRGGAHIPLQAAVAAQAHDADMAEQQDL